MNDAEKQLFKLWIFFINSPIENLIVIYDDIDISEGVVKIRKRYPGTHNGMRSIIEYLNNVNFFPRVRIGTGKPIVKELLIQHVIEKLSDDKYVIYVPAIESRECNDWYYCKLCWLSYEFE